MFFHQITIILIGIVMVLGVKMVRLRRFELPLLVRTATSTLRVYRSATAAYLPEQDIKESL
jgi:hypothetical protein